MFKLNVNTEAVIKYTSRLERMHKSNFPIAIRSALNSAAFDLKKETMPASAKKTFVNRNKNFFKVNSKVSPAQGFDVKNMKAVTGFISNKLKGSTNYSVRDLTQQEHGGKISGRKLIPTDRSRSSGRNSLVKRRNRIGNVKGAVDSNKIKGKNKKVKFIRASLLAGKNGHVIGNLNPRMVLRINSVKRLRNNNYTAKSTALYQVKNTDTIKVKGTSFMKKASLKSANKLESFYIKQAKKRINK